ncbi:hypothetical protein PspLS_03915 [Pyricularia sp. CBS 133598]|nr:hypothetical protein PspLS_03915 [Pyricularia sp. CBS 133598]
MLLFKTLFFLLPVVCLAETTEELPPTKVLDAQPPVCSNFGSGDTPLCSVCTHGCTPHFTCCKLPPGCCDKKES